jgi:serine phosphatase RsbU (regulator of sigma subunit)
MRYCLCILFNISLLSGLLAFDQIKVDSLTIVLEQKLTDKHRMEVLIALSKAHYYYNATKGLEYAGKALNIAQSTGSKKQEANAYYTIAINNFYLNKYDEAIIYTQKAKKVFMQLNQEEDYIKSLNTIGALYFQKEQHDVAYRYYDSVIIMSKRTGNAAMLTKAYHNKAMINQKVGEFREAIKWFRLSLKLEKDSVGMAETYNSIGLLYRDLIDTNLTSEENKYSTEQALSYFNRALSIYKKEDHEKGLDKIYFNMGSVHNRAGDLNAAFKNYLKSANITDKTNDSLNHIISQLATMLVYRKMGKDDARFLDKYYMALKVAERNDAFDLQIQLHENIGNVLIRKGAVKEALNKHFLIAWILAKKIYNYQELSTLGMVIAKYKEAMGDYKSAYEYQRSAILYKDSFENKNQLHKFRCMHFKEAIDKQVSLRKKEKAESGRLQRYTGFGGLFALLLALFIYFFYVQKQRINTRLMNRNVLIEQQKKDIEDSIIYAKRIQQAMLPFVPDNPKDEDIPKYLVDNMKQGFIIHKPKDIVSGDFYYTNITPEGKLIWLVGDCTGHGVPGAFMSILGNSLLNEVIIEKGISDPRWILEELRSKIISTLNQKGEFGDSTDGMDMALCVIDKDKLTFAGAYNPLYLVRKGELIEYKGDSQPVGYHTGDLKPFTQKEIDLKDGDVFYIFSDGYADQFGGPKGKKFMTRRFKKLLTDISDKHMNDQRAILIDTITQWMEEGNEEQIDDICILGCKV